jgi:hypothetical protein
MNIKEEEKKTKKKKKKAVGENTKVYHSIYSEYNLVSSISVSKGGITYIHISIKHTCVTR